MPDLKRWDTIFIRCRWCNVELEIEKWIEAEHRFFCSDLCSIQQKREMNRRRQYRFQTKKRIIRDYAIDPSFDKLKLDGIFRKFL